MKTLTFLTLILFVSCSQINKDSKEHYRTKYSIPHGIKPVKVSEPDLNKQIELDLKASNRGRELYSKHCQACHGKMGQGDGPLAEKLDIYPRDLVALIQKTPNFKFFLDISKWKGDMPGWWWNPKEVSDQDLEDITHYLRLLAAKDS